MYKPRWEKYALSSAETSNAGCITSTTSPAPYIRLPAHRDRAARSTATNPDRPAAARPDNRAFPTHRGRPSAPGCCGSSSCAASSRSDAWPWPRSGIRNRAGAPILTGSVPINQAGLGTLFRQWQPSPNGKASAALRSTSRFVRRDTRPFPARSRMAQRRRNGPQLRNSP